MRLSPFVFGSLLAVVACDRAPADSATSAIAYTEGDTKAPVQLTYFDDLVCDDCRQFSNAGAEPLRTKWIRGGKVRLTVVDLAWHRGSVAGSAAAVCAASQQKFWEMHELLFARQDTWKRQSDIPAALTKYAGELGLDTVRFAACAGEKSHQRRLDAAEDLARNSGVRGTPAFIVNGKPYFGAQDWDWMDAVLTAYAEGTPDKAPPPPLRTPTKKIVDSAELRRLQDSVRAASGARAPR